MAAGYSKRTLTQKLGLKSGFRVAFLHEPVVYRALLEPLPDKLHFCELDDGNLDFIHYFTLDRRQLLADLPRLKSALARTGMLWISWPKQSSSLKTELKGGAVREVGLASGLVDVKVCAVDQDWSGHKFVIRLRDR